MRARNGTTDFTGLYFSGAYRALYTNANSNIGSNGGSNWFINYVGSSSTGNGISEITFKPTGNELSFVCSSHDDYQPAIIVSAGRTAVGATANGFTIYPSAGTITGTSAAAPADGGAG